MLAIVIILCVIYLVYTIIPTYYFKCKMKFKRRKRGNVIYLTFDDGPSEYTSKLIDVLKKYDVHASFFLVGEFANKNKELVNKMINEGHLIAMHSYNHKSAHLMGIKYTNRDFYNSIDIVNSITKVKFYRPPWGAVNLCTLYNLKKFNLKLVLWNVMAEDWRGDITKKEIEEKLLNRIQAHDIICLHDGRGKNNAPLRTIEALEIVIPKLLEKGYKFEMVDSYEE